jgi:transcriptional regulator with XRE-family HTH domain
MDAKEILGANLRNARERHGWSQEEFADRSGIHRTYICGVERATRNPTLSIVQAIADALGITVLQRLEQRP